MCELLQTLRGGAAAPRLLATPRLRAPLRTYGEEEAGVAPVDDLVGLELGVQCIEIAKLREGSGGEALAAGCGTNAERSSARLCARRTAPERRRRAASLRQPIAHTDLRLQQALRRGLRAARACDSGAARSRGAVRHAPRQSLCAWGRAPRSAGARRTPACACRSLTRARSTWRAASCPRGSAAV